MMTGIVPFTPPYREGQLTEFPGGGSRGLTPAMIHGLDPALNPACSEFSVWVHQNPVLAAGIIVAVFFLAAGRKK